MLLTLLRPQGTGPSITGTLAAQEAQDFFAASGLLAHIGTLAGVEAQDFFLATGTVQDRPAPHGPGFIVNIGRMMGR
jgi:hypothetical protein